MSTQTSRDQPVERVLLVLGCPAHVDGTPRPPLSRRLTHTLALHLRFQSAPIVVTGGAVRGPPEAETMARWLAERGVPPELLRLEREARSTIQNVTLSLPMIEIGAAIHLVTERFHMPRARRLMEHVARGPVVPEVVDDTLQGWKRARMMALEKLKLARDLASVRTA